MHTDAYFQSLTLELKALQNRVRNFIEDAQWQTDGEWKETVIRSFLRRNLPSTVEVGRGFVLTPSGCSTQQDVLIFKSSSPLLFRDGDLVFITPDALVAAFEIKSRVDASRLTEAVEKLTATIRLLALPSRLDRMFGLFAFESTVAPAKIHEIIHHAADADVNHVIDLLCLGDSHLIRFANRGWSAYELPRTAPAYFLHNVIDHVCPESVRDNVALWFPPPGKEEYIVGRSTLNHPFAFESMT